MTQCSRMAWLCLLAVLSTMQMQTQTQMQVVGLKAVLLSRFSAVDSPQFRALVGNLIRGQPEGGVGVGASDVGVSGVGGMGGGGEGVQGMQGVQDVPSPGLVYIPTAQYAYRPESGASRGEQRRRARYEARQKGALLAGALGLRLALVELDAWDVGGVQVPQRAGAEAGARAEVAAVGAVGAGAAGADDAAVPVPVAAPAQLVQQWREQLMGAAAVYVDGGNTFYLQRHLLQSGFWELLKPRLEEGGFMFGFVGVFVGET
jgi:hypothetical protein